MNDNIILIFAGIIGVIAHLLINIRNLRHQSEKLVVEVNLRTYWNHEWDNIMLSVLAVVILVLSWVQIVESAEKFAPVIATAILHFSRLFFVAVGGAGDAVVMSFFGHTKKVIIEEIGALADKNNDVVNNTTSPS